MQAKHANDNNTLVVTTFRESYWSYEVKSIGSFQLSDSYIECWSDERKSKSIDLFVTSEDLQFFLTNHESIMLFYHCRFNVIF